MSYYGHDEFKYTVQPYLNNMFIGQEMGRRIDRMRCI